MDSVHFLNIEYFLVLIYSLFTGSHVDVSQIPHNVLTFVTYVAWIGLGVSVLFFFWVAYLIYQTRQVEHAGWHARMARIETMEERHITQARAVNPQWSYVEELISSPTESDWRRAILEADIMLGTMLTEQGYLGESIGEKLKTANPLQFTTLDMAWRAHKVRNQIAHAGQGFHLTQRDARATIDYYRRVFEEFDYI